MKVIFTTPTRDKPHAAWLAAMEACLPAIEAEGVEHSLVAEVGSPYISAARARNLGKALKVGFDYIVFLDDDVSWEPADMVKLLKAEGEVVGGVYRYKSEDEAYMGVVFTGETGKPLVREDGCMQADRLPAGFLRVSYRAVWKFAAAYPELICWGEKDPTVDLFNHGANEGQWWGEDYRFCTRWRAINEQIWLVPDLNLTHHGKDRTYPGNFHRFLLALGAKQKESKWPSTDSLSPRKRPARARSTSTSSTRRVRA